MAAPIKFNFAWVDASETTFGDSHKREDEKCIAFAIEHSEGEFATLNASIKNPRIGLLAPARKTWAWLSYGNTPIFFGRLVGVPNDLHQEVVTLVFTARPADFASQKATLAEALRVLPFYDPVFLSEDAQADPDTVLEGRPELWTIDRVTGVVSTSNILVGEDGLESFAANEVPRDSVRVTIGNVPIRNVTVDGQVNWKQTASGAMNMNTGTVLTYTGKSLISDWPKPGASLGGGWKCVASFANDDLNVDGTDVLSTSVSWSNGADKHAPGDTLSTSISSSRAPVRGDSVVVPLTLASKSGVGEASVESTQLRVPQWQVSTSLIIGYDAARDRKEHARFTLSADMQPIVTLPGDEESLILNMSGTDVGVPLLSGEVPIGDLSRRSYFSTDRGLQSLEYLLCLARTRLLMASRAVTIEWTCSFSRALALSLRKNAKLFDDRLPGGSATGKITKYAISGDGPSGVIMGSVTAGCAVGYGGALEAEDGDPLYCEEGYVAVNYQAYDNQVVVLDASDVGYTVPTDAPDDDGLIFPLTKSQVVLSEGWQGSADVQALAIQGAGVIPDTRYNGAADPQPAFDAATQIPPLIEATLKNAAVWYGLTLKGLDGGPFETVYDVDVTVLKIPKGIDLEAAELAS